jgi:DNA-binding NarL/FixJ family response regulator
MTAEPAQGAVEDALTQVRAARSALEQLRAQELSLTCVRDLAILELVASGLSYDAVARESGLTRGRIGQIVLRRSAG